MSDPGHLDEILGEGRSLASLDFLEQLLDAARIDVRTREVRLARVCLAKDPKELEGLLHGFIGCFSSLGWARLVGLCQRERSLLRSGQFTHWETFAVRFHLLFESTAKEMEQFLVERRKLAGAPAHVTAP